MKKGPTWGPSSFIRDNGKTALESRRRNEWQAFYQFSIVQITLSE